MIKRLVKAVAYTKAPMRTFFLLHPRRALKYGALFWLGKKIFYRPRRESPPAP